jgi:hypothetical protein
MDGWNEWIEEWRDGTTLARQMAGKICSVSVAVMMESHYGINFKIPNFTHCFSCE